MQIKAKKCRLVFLLLISTAVTPVTNAQEVIFRLDGLQEAGVFGSAVACIDDIDGDGVPDIAIAAPLARGGDVNPDGKVLIYSGASGTLLRRLDPIEPRGLFGGSIANAGDVDGDHVPDILIGAPYTSPDFIFGAGSALIYSGATGEVLSVFNGREFGNYLGWSVAGLGDINGDGKPDVIVGAPYASSEGRIGVGSAEVFSSFDGKTVFRFYGDHSGDYLGWAVSGAGDIDGDGIPDILIGAPFASPNERAQAGSVYVRSGATGNLIFQLNGIDAGDNFGKSIAAVGDIDGDAIPDILVGAPSASPDGREKAGSAFIYSGRTREIIFRFDGPAAFDEFGASVSSAGDIDGDGVPDVIIGAPGSSPNGIAETGSAFVFSGATGNLIFRFDGPEQDAKLGFSVAGTRDVCCNSYVVIGAPYANPKGLFGAGSAFVLR